MATGIVKWFNPAKGYAVERAGLATLNEGRKISFEAVPGRNGKLAAENLVLEG